MQNVKTLDAVRERERESHNLIKSGLTVKLNKEVKNIGFREIGILCVFVV